MYTINAKATTTKIRVVASKPTKEIKWSNKKYSKTGSRSSSSPVKVQYSV